MEEDDKQFYYNLTPTRDVSGYIHVDPVTGESKAVSSGFNQNGNRTVLGNNASFNLGEATGTGWNRMDRERLRRAFHMNIDDPETVRRIKTYHTNEDGSINWHSFNFNPWIADNFVSVTNPEGMARIRNAVKGGGDIAGAFGTAVLASPLVLEAAPSIMPAFNRLGQSAVGQTAKVMFDPYTIPGAITNSALTAPFAADMMNNGVNAENAIGVGLGALPYAGPALVRGYNIGKNLYTKGPKYIFDNLPYKTIYNVQKAASNIKSDASTFFRTPINENPIKAVRNRYKSLQVGKTPRTDIVYDNNVYYNANKSSIQNINDPISQIRGRLRTRMNNGDYQYSYPNDGIGISPDKNMYNPDYIISQIPVKDYLSLKDVYKLGIDRHSGFMDKISNAIQTPINYLKANTEPAFSYTGGNRFVKVNKKAIKDLGFDYPTVLSHEYNHALRNEFIDDGKLQRHLGFNYDHLAPKYKKYLFSPTEIEARGTQLKNYFNSDVITSDMLKYAAKHYVPDTNMDNNMYQFFSGIKDWNLAADYLSKFSLKNGGKM